MSEIVWVNTKMPIEIDNQLRRAAADLRISRSELVRLAVEAFLTKENMVGATAEVIQRVEARDGVVG